MINRIKWFLLVITAVFLLFWFVSIVGIEILTFRHNEGFIIPDDVAWFVGTLDNIKVLEHTEHSARIYFYTRRAVGIEIHFVRSRNEMNGCSSHGEPFGRILVQQVPMFGHIIIIQLKAESYWVFSVYHMYYCCLLYALYLLNNA